MEGSQDLLQLDNEIGRINIMRDSDSSLAVLPSPDIFEDLRTGLNTPPTTPQQSPHAFLKEDRWLFSPPPVLTSEHTNLDNFRTEFSATPHDTEKWKKSPVLRKKATHPASLVLPTEEHSPRKRIKPTTVATLLGHNSQGMSEPSTIIGIEHFGVPSFLLVRPVPRSVGTEPAIWNPPPLLQIVSHLTSDLVRKLTTSRISYVSSLAYQT